MWRKLWLFILKKFYRLLIVKISFVEKLKLAKYEYFKTFCTLTVSSDKGDFTFVFKEDRRRKVRNRLMPKSIMSSYFVELVPPAQLVNPSNAFKDKIAVVIKIRINAINYEALAGLLLDLYIDTYNERSADA